MAPSAMDMFFGYTRSVYCSCKSATQRGVERIVSLSAMISAVLLKKLIARFGNMFLNY